MHLSSSTCFLPYAKANPSEAVFLCVFAYVRLLFIIGIHSMVCVCVCVCVCAVILTGNTCVTADGVVYSFGFYTAPKNCTANSINPVSSPS